MISQNNNSIFRAERPFFEKIYHQLNKRELVHPDPLEFLYRYQNKEDREIAGLIASSLAYGRVTQILKSVESVLGKLSLSPSIFISETDPREFRRMFGGFKHRFTDGHEIASLLTAIKEVKSEYGLLEVCFKEGLRRNNSQENCLGALSFFVKEITRYFEGGETYLVPHPEKGSACKRLNLFLRWMVRKDDVDSGDWEGIERKLLLVPLDTHMNNICKILGFTARKSADMKTVLEISRAFAKINPDDPVKYDFALTRLGIHPDMKISDLKNYI
ncbi:MAG: TIGR02757 family protein [Lentisphaerae bacterium GWF2_45_14]|nr:MAG: TIGR02757 family protein [Lentisphaerae bacterium GWF2_45_14]